MTIVPPLNGVDSLRRMDSQTIKNGQHITNGAEFASVFEVMPVYVLETSMNLEILTTSYHPTNIIDECDKWVEGVSLKELYDDSPIFIHHMSRCLQLRKRSEAVLKLGEHTFEVYFSPRINENDHIKGLTIFLKKIPELRKSSFDILAVQEELQVLKRDIENVGESNLSSETNDKLNQVLKDVTEKLKEQEKMASLGMNLSSIAHEMKNPAGSIMNSLTGLKSTFEELAEFIPKNEETSELIEEVEGMLSDINIGAVRTVEIAKSLTTYARQDQNEKEVANINELLKSTLVVLKHKTKFRVEIEEDYDESHESCLCFPGHLGQAFLNIINNAIDAIPEERKDGKISITSKETETNIIVTIEDNGTGMSEEVQKKIFEPLFTTKAVGEGTGLGMPITKEIVENHEGELLVHSEVGKGTKFTMKFSKT